MSPAGYAQTKSKLAELQRRLAALEERTDLSPLHCDEVRRSYERMMRQYLREIKLFEAAQEESPGAPPEVGDQGGEIPRSTPR